MGIGRFRCSVHLCRFGYGSEYLVLRAFELDGAEVRWPFEVKVDGETVEQIDGAVYAGHLAFLVESKDSAGALDVAALAKMTSLRRGSDPRLFSIG
jgi:hypothetical protein